MTDLIIYDPAMCCPTGICGAEIDQTLVTFAADLDWLKSQGVTVRRISLSQEPAEFVANETIRAVLEKDGTDGLPAILRDGALYSRGRYPARAELAKMVGVDFTPGASPAAAQTKPGKCCGTAPDTGDTDTAPSGCCG